MITPAGIRWSEGSDGGLSARYPDGGPYPFRWIPNDWGKLTPRLVSDPDVPVTWAPLPGAQELFITCPYREALLHGNRGSGKTESLIACYAQHVGRGFGTEWQGVIFRETYKQLGEVWRKCTNILKRSFPDVRSNQSQMFWQWPDGEKLWLSYLRQPSDADNWQGFELPFIAFEELTNFAMPEGYTRLIATQRSSNPAIPLLLRATCNPSGIGHNWVKHRFRLSGIPQSIVGQVIDNDVDEEGNPAPTRVSFFADARENKVLLHAQPNYLVDIAATAESEAQREAWANGNWDIVAGGMFNDRFRTAIHVLPDFPIEEIPASWRIYRAYDHGQSAPFSVGWWARSDGSPITYTDGRGNRHRVGDVRGDCVRFVEWYGWSGKPNHGINLEAREIAKGIREREKEMGIDSVVRTGPADNQVFAAMDGARSVASEMAKERVRWHEVDKSPGSREQGWQVVRAFLRGAYPDKDGYREEPGVFIADRCQQWLRTVPVLTRDEQKPDDVPRKSENHIADETRYFLRWEPPVSTVRANALVY